MADWRRFSVDLHVAVSAGGFRDDWHDTQKGWSVSSPPKDVSRSDYQSYPFDSTALAHTGSQVLYTQSTSAPLRIHGPEEASLFVLYGFVRPNQGEFEVELLPADKSSELESDFHLHYLTRSYSANRQIESMEEMLATVWLDPRVQYDDVEIRSGEEHDCAICSMDCVDSELARKRLVE